MIFSGNPDSHASTAQRNRPIVVIVDRRWFSAIGPVACRDARL